jgi:copper chaperone NosL
MQPIKWDRDTCARCNMVISDPRFAAELRGGEKDVVFKFDDIGCLVFWLRDKAAQHPWMGDPATRMWVADSTDMSGATWLDPRAGALPRRRLSPMGYNFAAVAGRRSR